MRTWVKCFSSKSIYLSISVFVFLQAWMHMDKYMYKVCKYEWRYAHYVHVYECGWVSSAFGK